MIISSKAEFYRRWQLGLLGNRPKSWLTVEDLAADPYTGTVTARSMQKSFASMYRVPKEKAILMYGYKFNESPPDELLVIQGEAMRSPRGLELTYSYDKLPMKQCSFNYTSGLRALYMLDEDVLELLDEYDGHVVEFSTYSIRLGTCHRRTIIWEVRTY